MDEQALVGAGGREGMANIIHLELLVKVDLIVPKDTPNRREEFRRRRSAELDGVTIWFVAPEDLVLSGRRSPRCASSARVGTDSSSGRTRARIQCERRGGRAPCGAARGLEVHGSKGDRNKNVARQPATKSSAPCRSNCNTQTVDN